MTVATPLGQHLILDAWGAPHDVLNNPDLIQETVSQAIEAGDATLIDWCVHSFSPQGVTATATLAESHIAIHTWPEHGYFAADLFFCGQGSPDKAAEVIRTRLQATHYRLQTLSRGFG